MPRTLKCTCGECAVCKHRERRRQERQAARGDRPLYARPEAPVVFTRVRLPLTPEDIYGRHPE